MTLAGAPDQHAQIGCSRSSCLSLVLCLQLCGRTALNDRGACGAGGGDLPLNERGKEQVLLCIPY